MRNYINLITETSQLFNNGHPVWIQGAPAYNPAVSHSPRLFVLYDETGKERAGVLRTMAQAPNAKYSSFTPVGAKSHEEFSKALEMAQNDVGINDDLDVIQWSDLSSTDKKIITTENIYESSNLEEGWKSAFIGAAAGAAAMAGAYENNRSYDDMPFTSAFAAAMEEKGEGETFSWRGKEYKLEKAARPAAEPSYTLRRDDGRPIKLMSDEEYEALLRAKIKEEVDQIDEGWKSALGAAALGAAALTGLSNTSDTSASASNQQSDQIEQAPLSFSPETEKVAREQGFKSAEEMYYFVRNQRQGATVQTTQFDKVVKDAKSASVIVPGNLIKYVSDKFSDATKNTN